jgi:ATP-dependent helicase HrpA
LKRHLLPAEAFYPLTRADFEQAVQRTRLEMPGVAIKLVDRVGVILRARKEIQQRCGATPALPSKPGRTLTDLSQLSLAGKEPVKPANLWAEELENLLPRNFLAVIPFEQLTEVPRYLKALQTRMERAKLNPAKDKERAAAVATYLEKYKALAGAKPKGIEARRQREELRWLIEEYKVSLFAQELGTAVPISPKRLDEYIGRMEAV